MSLLATSTVLVVEPDPVTRDTYRRALTGAGFRVTAVDNGAAAVSFLEQYRPAAVVFEPVAPPVNGIDLHQQLRAQPKTKDVPAILVVASDAKNEPSPFDTVVRKPVRVEQLVAAVETAVSRSSTSKYVRFYDEDAEEEES